MNTSLYNGVLLAELAAERAHADRLAEWVRYYQAMAVAGLIPEEDAGNDLAAHNERRVAQ